MNKKDITIANAIQPFRDLSENHQRFVVAYASGKSLVDSAQFAFPAMSRDNARKYGSKLLLRADINACITELRSFKEKTIDISKQAMASRMMMLIGQMQSGPMTAKHFDVVTKILDMFNRMNGNYVSDESDKTQPVVHITLQAAPPRAQITDGTIIDITADQNHTPLQIEDKKDIDPPSLSHLEDFLNEPEP